MNIFFKIALYFFVITNYFTIQAQHNWIRTNPGGGGAIATVVATADGTILAGSDLSGVYRSKDNGQTWDVLGANQGIIETHISSFGLDPNDANTFFAGAYTGAYKTTDGGENFTYVFPDASHNFDYSYIEDIAIAKSNSNIGYITHHPQADADGDIYKTTDGGDSWHAIVAEDLPNDLHLIKILIHPTDENIVYVLSGKSRWGCGRSNLYKSVDGGVHWLEIGDSEGDILDMDVHPTDTSIVFISTYLSGYINNDSCRNSDEFFIADEYAGEFYKSTNGGNSFTEISDKTGIISVGINDPNTIKLMDVLLPYDWNSNAGTWETTNGGQTWAHIGTPTNWEKGYTENQYFTLGASFNGLNKTVTKDIFNTDNFYGSFGQWAWGSFDGGITMNNISTEKIDTNEWLSTGMENINGHCLDINESNPNIVYMGGYDIGFWYSKNNGNSWTRTQPDYNIYPEYSWNLGTGTIPTNLAKRGAGTNVMTILSDPDRENVVWASFSEEQLTDTIEGMRAHTGLFKSTNYGEDWQLITNGLPPFNQSIRMFGLSIDNNSPSNNRTMYITVDGNIYRSIDDGINWQLVLTNGNLKFTEVDKFDGNIIYAGGKDGLWKSADAGNSWQEIGLAEMHNLHQFTRPDIVPTWVDWSTDTYPYEGVFDIQTDPNVQNRLYVTVIGKGKGLYQSEDAGQTWNHILTDSTMRGVAIAPENSDVIYATSSMSYHSGGYGNSLGIMYSEDAGNTWQAVNDGMAYNYGGIIEVETGMHPNVWVWSPGTGVQKAAVPYFTNTAINEIESKYNIYPNPTNGTLYLDKDIAEKQFKITDNLGKIVLEGMVKNNAIDLNKLHKGMYFLSFKNDSENYIKVLIR